MRTTIIMPARDAAPWIEAAVRAVLAQTCADWQLLVIDDGSRDATAAIVRGCADPRVRLLQQAPQGVSAARNRGLADAGGDALLFLDADDCLAPDALARLTAALAATPTAVAASCPAAFVARDGTRRPGVLRPPAGDLLPALLERNLFANGGHVLLRRAAAAPFRTDLVYGEDWEYWVRLALQGIFAATEGDPGLFVRQRAAGACQLYSQDPAAFTPCLQAIFGNPALAARFGAGLPLLRRRAEAERDWIVGRERLRNGEPAGKAWLRRSVAAKPSPKRLALLAAAHAVPVLPMAWRGPFARYRNDCDRPEARLSGLLPPVG